MSVRGYVILGVVIAGAVALAATRLLTKSETIAMDGAVLQASMDAQQQAPIAGVGISVNEAGRAVAATSDVTGFFSFTLPPAVVRGERVTLRFRNPGYRPLDLDVAAGDGLVIARMTPLAPPPVVESNRAGTSIANVHVRYSVTAPNAVNVGSGVKVFQVVNTGNIPCNGREPCSPDGKWKAGVGTASLDAGPNDQFRNARVSCIAGPCPFTKIDADQFSAGGPHIAVTVRDWSDTATFVLQAEVVRVEMSDAVRDSYPVIIGRTMNFTLPARAEGPSVEAEVDGTRIVFPLGPRLQLSWASCEARPDKNLSRVYRCELKAGYRFQ